MSIYSSKRKARRVSKTHLGHLKLSVIEESSALVVHIFEARGLQRKDSSSQETYVKIYLLPDPHKLTKEKTKIVKQKDPVFNEKFSFILSENDQDKMLFVSVWTHQMTSRNEMLGCMTFMIADLLGPNKGLNGWYKVLDDIQGRLENVQVPTSITKYEASVSKYGSSVLSGQKNFAVMIMKSQKGYGFNVYGHNPIYITQVTQGLPAANADLRVGDIILEVQGTDVRRASGDQVVEMIQKCPNTLHMILKRDLTNPQHLYSSRSSKKRPSDQYNSLSRTRSSSYLSISSPNHHASEDTLMAPPSMGRSHHPNYYGSQSQLLPEFHHNPYHSTLPTSPPHRLNRYSTMTGGRSYSTGGGGFSQPAFMFGTGTHPPGASYEDMLREHGKEELGTNMYPKTGHTLYGTTAIHNTTGRRMFHKTRSSEGSFENNLATSTHLGRNVEKSVMSQPDELPMELYSRKNNGGGSSHHRTLSQSSGGSGGGLLKRKSMTQLEGRRDLDDTRKPFTRTTSLNPHHLASAGTSYKNRAIPSDGNTSDTMSSSAERSSSVSSPSTLSNTSDGVPVEWESLPPLEQKRQKAINKLMEAELSLCSELEMGVETYIRPLKFIIPEDSHQKIFLGIPELYVFSATISEQLKSRRKLYKNDVSSVSHYLYAVADIYASKFQSIVQNLRLYAQNYYIARQEIALSFTNENFTKLVQESVRGSDKHSIYSFVESGKEYIQKLCRWMMALLYLTPIHHPDQKHLHLIVEALLPLTSDKELLAKWDRDQDTMRKKQVCVGFGSKVASFPILVPGRFLLHEGEVSMLEKRKKKKLWLMLFSDIVLLTQRNGRIFTCVEDPVVLENLTVPDVNCNEPTDFQLVVVEGVVLNRLFRASSVAAKEEWVEKLKERASGSLANRKKTGDKSGINPRLQETFHKQSHVIAATLASNKSEVDVTAHAPMTTIPESTNTAAASAKNKSDEQVKSDGESTTQPSESPLKRGISKRRSLFSVGRRDEQTNSTSTGRKKDKKKSTSKSPAASPMRSEPMTLHGVSVETLKEWETSFSSLLKHPDGIQMFENFLVSEYSEENIQFWKACERFKTVPSNKIEEEAAIIYQEYISPQAPKLVNIDYQTSREIAGNIKSPDKTIFNHAQQSIYLLMARDSFVRFIKSDTFQSALKK